MNQTPILFSTAMVRAILNGSKSQTRRTRGLDIINQQPDNYHFNGFVNNAAKFIGINAQYKEVHAQCPYGQSGHILWVRETFLPNQIGKMFNKPYLYAADNHTVTILKWKPSIHMPKIAARIWLQVEYVGIERLHDISNINAIYEGIEVGYCAQNNGPDLVTVEGADFNEALAILSNK